MKRIHKATMVLAGALLLGTGLFTACPNNPDPADPGKDNTNQDTNTPPGSGGEDENPDDSIVPEIYREYMIGATDSDIAAIKSFEDWGSGTTYKDNEDGTITLTAGSNWGERAYLSYGGITPGYLSRFARVVVLADVSAFEASGDTNVLFSGTGTDEYLKAASKSGEGTVTYIFNISDSKSAESQKQASLIFYGTGSVTVKEWYFEADSKLAVFKTPLTDLISASNTLKNGAQVGTAGGQYPKDAYDAFNAAISAATDVANSTSSTQKEIYASYYELSEAKSVFEAAKLPDIPFTELSGTEIPEGAIVIFDASNISEAKWTANNSPWWLPDGGSFTIKQVDFEESKIYEVVTKEVGSCGCFNVSDSGNYDGKKDSGIKITSNSELYISLYSSANTRIKPAHPDSEDIPTIEGKEEWQLIKIKYNDELFKDKEKTSLYQIGFIAAVAEESSVFIDAVYLINK